MHSFISLFNTTSFTIVIGSFLYDILKDDNYGYYALIWYFVLRCALLWVFVSGTCMSLFMGVYETTFEARYLQQIHRFPQIASIIYIAITTVVAIMFYPFLFQSRDDNAISILLFEGFASLAFFAICPSVRYIQLSRFSIIWCIVWSVIYFYYGPSLRF